MPNAADYQSISTTNKNAMYQYKCTITPLFGDNKPLNPLQVKTITLDYKFERNNFPLIFTTLALKESERNLFIENQGTKNVLFRLQKFVMNSNMPGLLEDYINEECVYFISSDVSKEDEVLIDDRETHRVCTVGFIALKHINLNRLPDDRDLTARKGSTSAYVYYMLQGQPVLMEPLTNNPPMDGNIIPPNDSVYRVVKYINSLHAFYNTPLRFFFDYDMLYLMSSSGEGLRKKGEEILTVKIVIHNKYAEEDFDGMYTDMEHKLYLIELYAGESNINTPDFSSKAATTIAAVRTEGGQATAGITNDRSNSSIRAQSNAIRIPNSNSNMVKNMGSRSLDSNIVLTFHKSKVDTTIFTMNKFYTVVADEAYGSEYSGTYLLTAKQEVYAQEGENLNVSIIATLKKKVG